MNMCLKVWLKRYSWGAGKLSSDYSSWLTQFEPISCANWAKYWRQEIACETWMLCRLHLLSQSLTIPDKYDAKIVEICNLWTFWPVIHTLIRIIKPNTWNKPSFIICQVPPSLTKIRESSWVNSLGWLNYKPKWCFWDLCPFLILVS